MKISFIGSLVCLFFLTLSINCNKNALECKEELSTPLVEKEQVNIPKPKDSIAIIYVISWEVVDTANLINVKKESVQSMLDYANTVFEPINIRFELLVHKTLTDYYTFEALTEDYFKLYYRQLIQHNTPNVIDLYLVDHETDICYNDGKVAGCHKVHGFTNIGGETSSIVLGKEDLSDAKIPIHELGHFFNLPHTHHEDHYSMLIQELADGSECSQKGDFICDTPPDPDAGIYSTMVNYTDCEMYGVYDENGVAYKPMINNFMGYYSACYMRSFLFTAGQYGVMRRFSKSGNRVGYLNYKAPKHKIVHK